MIWRIVSKLDSYPCGWVHACRVFLRPPCSGLFSFLLPLRFLLLSTVGGLLGAGVG